MNVLLTNDDGILAPGLGFLNDALAKAGHKVFAIAPVRQQSGAAHSVTVFSPLLAEKVVDGDFSGFGVHGTPADCVKLGLGTLCPFRPDLVISGINLGPNAGPDIHYSGTVGAAAEAAHAGIPAIAVSRHGYEIKSDLGKIAEHLVSLAESLQWNRLPQGTMLNVNYPVKTFSELTEVRVCPQSCVQWPNNYSERKDPRGKSYWWFDSQLDSGKFETGSDRKLLEDEYITVTPLKFDYTDYSSLEELARMLAGLTRQIL